MMMKTMDKMTSVRRGGALVLALVLMGATMTGCVQADDGGSPQPSMEEGARKQAAFLFRDPISSGPRLDVYDVEGHAAIAVSGPIGSEVGLSGLTGDASLEQLYRAVHPTVSVVPEDLLALQERLAPVLEALRSTHREPVSPQLINGIDKSQAGFNSAVCKTFKGEADSIKYVPIDCTYSPFGNSPVHQRGWANWGDPRMLAGDRTYAWNNTSKRAFLGIATATDWAYWHELPAYWWTWVSMSSGGPYQSVLFPDGVGDVGITWHDFQWAVK